MKRLLFILILLCCCSKIENPLDQRVPIIYNNMFMGDSIIALNNWSSFNNNINEGISGSTAENWLSYSLVYDLKDYYNNVYISLGVNDLGKDYSIQDTINNYNKILNIISSRSENIYIMSVMSINISKYTQAFGKQKHYLNMNDSDVVSFNSNLKSLTNNNIKYIDIYSSMVSNGELRSSLTDDGIHPNTAGYTIIENLLKAVQPND